MIRRPVGARIAQMIPVAIVASYVVYAPDVLAPIEPPKTFIVAMILGVAIIRAISTGAWRVALKQIRMTWRHDNPWLRTALASLATFLVVAVASTAASIVPRSSLLGTLNRGQGTLFVATVVVAIALSWPILRTSSGARNIVRAIGLGGIIPATIAIGQSVGYDLVSGGIASTDRASGTLGNPVNLATMMAMSAVAAMALAHEAWTASRNLPVSGGEGELTPANGSVTSEIMEGSPPAPRGAISIFFVAIGVALAIATRLAGIKWPEVEWTVVPASVVASALIAWPADYANAGVTLGPQSKSSNPTLLKSREVRWRAYLWAIVAVACIAAIGASRSRGPAIALGIGASTWVTLAVLPRPAGLVRRAGIGVAVAGSVTIVAFVAGSALPATVRAVRALPAGSIGGGGAMAEVQAQANAVGRDTIGTREIAWASSLDTFRYGSRVLDPRWVGTAMASSGHQMADLEAISTLPDHRAMSSLLRRAIGYGPESQVALIGTDAAGQPFDRAHAAPLDILLTQGAIGLATAAVLAVATVVVSVRFGGQDEAFTADRTIVPLLVTSGVASLTGVDGTAQVLATWALVAVALARAAFQTAAEASSVSDGPAMPSADQNPSPSLRAVGTGCAIATSGVVLTMVIADGPTDPATWGISAAAAMVAVCVMYSHRPSISTTSAANWTHNVVAPCVVVSIMMTPAWSALAAGASARAATMPGTSVEDRQVRLSRAIVVDPGLVTYRELRGI